MRAVIAPLLFVVALSTPALSLRGQVADTTIRVEGLRSPMLARTLGIVPGLGHAYAGEARRGLAFTAAFLGAGAVLVGTAAQCFTIFEESPCGEEADLVMVVSAIAIPVIWVANIADAGHTAKRRNRARSAALVASPLQVQGPAGTARGFRVGLRITQ